MTAGGAAVRVDTPSAFRFLWEGAYRYRVAYGGRGSAKSWQFARRLLVKAHQEPRRRILCTREFQSSIRDSVHQLLKTQLYELGLAPWFDIKRDSILHRNGSEFIFKGLRHDVQEIQSTEGIDVCWVEEGQSISQNSWDVLVPTIRRPESQIWVTFNPREESDPIYQRMVVKPPPPERAVIVKVSWKDNPYLPQVLLDELEDKRRLDPEGFAHIWEGATWHRAKEQVLDGRWRVADFEADPTTWHGPYFGADWGFASDPLFIGRCWIYDKRLWIDYERQGLNVGNDQIAPLFRELPDVEGRIIRADSSRPETIAHVRSKGLSVVAAEQWPGSVEDGVAHLRSYEEIIIHPRCEFTQQEARSWKYKVDRLTGDVLPALVDAHNHSWDAFRYALAPLIRRRLRPQLLV